MSQIKVFYAHSSRNDQTNTIYETVIEMLLKDSRFIIIPSDKPDAVKIDDDILAQIEMADIFLADITPDYIVEDKILFNEHVMMEVGYALRCHQQENILLFYNSDQFASNDNFKMEDRLPIFLKTTKYNIYSFKDEGHKNILECIDGKVKEFDEYQEWITDNQFYSKLFYDAVVKTTNMSIKKLTTRINVKQGRVVIFIHQVNNNTDYFIDVRERLLYKKNKKRNTLKQDLSTFSDINNELKHIETIAMIRLALLT